MPTLLLLAPPDFQTFLQPCVVPLVHLPTWSTEWEFSFLSGKMSNEITKPWKNEITAKSTHYTWKIRQYTSLISTRFPFYFYFYSIHSFWTTYTFLIHISFLPTETLTPSDISNLFGKCFKKPKFLKYVPKYFFMKRFPSLSSYWELSRRVKVKTNKEIVTQKIWLSSRYFLRVPSWLLSRCSGKEIVSWKKYLIWLLKKVKNSILI